MSDYSLTALRARTDMLACLHTYCQAIDLREWSRFDRVFHDDGVCRLSNLGGPWREWLVTARSLIETTEATQHHLGNTLFFFDGEDRAYTESYVTAHHIIPADAAPRPFLGGTGERHDVIIGSRYVDTFARRDGRWRIAERRAVAGWRHIQPCRFP